MNQHSNDKRAADFINCLSRTLGEANRFLIDQIRACGLEGLVPSHGDIMVQLFAHQPMAMQELARAVNRDPSTVTALVGKLVRAGYVTTARSAADGRVIEVSLTDKGAALRRDFDAISERLVDTQMQSIDDAAFAITCATLDAIRGNFSRAVGCDASGTVDKKENRTHE